MRLPSSLYPYTEVLAKHEPCLPRCQLERQPQACSPVTASSVTLSDKNPESLTSSVPLSLWMRFYHHVHTYIILRKPSAACPRSSPRSGPQLCGACLSENAARSGCAGAGEESAKVWLCDQLHSGRDSMQPHARTCGHPHTQSPPHTLPPGNPAVSSAHVATRPGACR